MNNISDTICALSTARGRAGIAIVRISGPECSSLIRKSFIPEHPLQQWPARLAVLGRVLDPRSEEELDQALLTFFPAPNSYTGEDVAEISLHGSPVLIAALLESLCCAGARLAEPGEFTLRAFLHGRMDLCQAEAVHDVIEATTLHQAKVASRQRSGELSRALDAVKKTLVDIIVSLETAVEFVEEDLSLPSRSRIAERLDILLIELKGWIDSFRRGRIIRDGFTLAVIGRPNVGKSSLFNALLAQHRSIVTEQPGTTRDLVSEYANLDGVPVRLLDTAGICRPSDHVERFGIERSYQAMVDADALLFVIDASRALSEEDVQLRNSLGDASSLVVFNKTDLPSAWNREQRDLVAADAPRVEVSAKTGTGIEELRKTIFEYLFGGKAPERDGYLVTNVRHCRCLEAAWEGVRQAQREILARMSEEFVLVDLHRALKSLGEITGDTTVEDLLGQIFSRFCIGK